MHADRFPCNRSFTIGDTQQPRSLANQHDTAKNRIGHIQHPVSTFSSATTQRTTLPNKKAHFSIKKRKRFTELVKSFRTKGNKAVHRFSSTDVTSSNSTGGLYTLTYPWAAHHKNHTYTHTHTHTRTRTRTYTRASDTYTHVCTYR
jgi:hypothetical protein